MHPIICKIGPVQIYSYGFMLAVAVLVCAFLLKREAPKRGFNPEDVLDLIFWVVVGGIVGARLFYVFLNLPYFLSDPRELVMLQHGGLAFQGGLAGGILAALIFVRLKKMRFLLAADLLAPYVALGHAIGRLGCFFNGCCFGKAAAWGVYFPVHAARLHPAQLYESAGLFLIFLFLKRFGRTPHKPGEIFVLYLMLASALRFINEFFRGDHADLWMGLSVFQIVCIFVFAAAVYAKFHLQSR